LPIADSEDETPPSKRRGIALCLSGGGFRATLFHLGAVQRLFELGIATRPDFDTIASVSGGSITAAQWAIAEAQAATNEN
jgi:NTE family protein